MFDDLSVHDLLAGSLDDLVAENANAARRLGRMYAFYCRLKLDYEARKADEPRFTLTPLQETVIEVSELWGLSAGKVRRDVATTRLLVGHFGEIWDLCLAGQLDIYKATIIAETAGARLDRPEEFARLAEHLLPWLLRSIPQDPERRGLVNRTVDQLRRKLSYELSRMRPKDSDERRARAFAERRASNASLGDGMGILSLTGSIDQVQLADYRLTLVAKAFRADGDQRTLEQLRTDLAFDLMTGRLAVDAGLGALEHADNTGDTSEVAETIRHLPTLAFARPIINVTVPIQTLMGLSDSPGTLSGGELLPASLTRTIAGFPESTWHRMLTDPAGGFVELSTQSYRPTGPIWRHVVGRDPTCYRNNCNVASTQCEVDHKVPYPKGTTSPANLQPACRNDHKAKHARGFGIGVDPDGTPTFHTRAGFTHRSMPNEHPVVGPDDPDRAHLLTHTDFTATEFFDTLEHLRRLETDRAGNSTRQYEEQKLRACYAASYPEATNEEIQYWIYGDPFEDEDDHIAPPITVEGYTDWEHYALSAIRLRA